MSRPRGTGRIYTPKESSILWIQYYRNGKMYRESTGTTDKRKATRILSRRLAEISTGSFTGPDVARIRVSELAEDFLRDYRINGRASIDDAEARWRLHIEPFFGSLRVSAVTSDLLDRYVDRRQQQGAKNATINRELAALKRMFHLGHDATPPKLFYIPRFPNLTENNIRQGFLEDEQYEKLLQSCPELWFQALVEAGCTYGWRVGELLKLKVNQVDLRNRVIRLHPGTTKNKDGREVTMTQPIYDLFVLCVEGKAPHDYLFTRPNGQRVRDFRGTWDKARIAAGVPNLLFHDLRRTAARNFRRAGIAEGVIMKIGGWRTRSVFERYAIISHTDIEDALQKLENRRQSSRQKRSATPRESEPAKKDRSIVA
jgi:integrase